MEERLGAKASLHVKRPGRRDCSYTRLHAQTKETKVEQRLIGKREGATIRAGSAYRPGTTKGKPRSERAGQRRAKTRAWFLPPGRMPGPQPQAKRDAGFL